MSWERTKNFTNLFLSDSQCTKYIKISKGMKYYYASFLLQKEEN